MCEGSWLEDLAYVENGPTNKWLKLNDEKESVE